MPPTKSKSNAILARGLYHDEAWRQIPPEEKLDIVEAAQAKGLLAAVISCVVGGTMAVALGQVWFLWGSLLASPLVYQFAAGKAWRTVKPAIMLRYLAARSAARRYAYSAKSRDLELSLIFRANLERVYGEMHVQEALEAMARNIKEIEVWVALFEDVLIIMSEQRGGAALEYAQIINERMTIEAKSSSGGDYVNDKELFITSRDRHDKEQQFKLTSPFPGALVVFEKRLRVFQSRRHDDVKELVQEALPMPSDDSEDDNYQQRDIF